MEEILENLSIYQRGSIAQSTDMAIIEECEPEKVIYDNVKIAPSKIILRDAFDGKEYTTSFSIINCGKNSAFVRIFPPTSHAFKMKPLKRGRHLASGLRVTRTIHYVHSTAMALNKACLFIYVNDQPFTYDIDVHLIAAYVTLSPNVLNFGEIDVGNASEQKSIRLKNIGHRIAQFSVDLSRNDLELIVDPMKGIIMPEEDVEIKVEVLGYKVGSFQKEFWLKTEPPRRVKFNGVFIAPKILVQYPISNFNLIMVDFPRTYYRSESVKTIVLNNSSSTDRMFCLVSESGKEIQCLREAKKTNEMLRCFSFNCMEGRLQARQNFVLRFTFSPQKLENSTQKACQTFVRVAEVNYRDGVIQEREEVLKTFKSSASFDEFLASPMDNLQEFDDIIIPMSGFIRLCLYGEMSEPRVKLSPQTFTLSYLQVGETYDRIVCIKNFSRHLPIAYRTNVVPCVKVSPSEELLNPEEALEITLSIMPSGEGTRTYKVKFDLIHRDSHKEYKVGAALLPVTFSASTTYREVQPKFNMGITPQVTNEVGFLVDDVRFNTNIEKPRQAIVDKNHSSFNQKNDALIAFPNDRPKCLRPWKKSVPCRTIFAKLPRIVTDQDEYTLTPLEMENKLHNDNIYLDYIRQLAAVRPKFKESGKRVRDYLISNRCHLLLENLPSSEMIGYHGSQHVGCIALTPEQLMGVIIKPKYVYLGKIAPYTMCTDSFSIQNNNEFSIHVSIKALSNSVVIKEKSQIIINAHETKDIFFDCFSHGYGKFYVPVYILINYNHIFDATVFASVVPTTVKCDQKEIIINPRTHRNFFELYNPVNCDIKFYWEIQDRNFIVVPDSGVVPPRKNVYCSVTFVPQINATYKTEIYLHSQSGAKQIIVVICKNESASIGFSVDKVKFDNIPLNTTVTEEVVLRNFSDEEIVYIVNNPNPLEEIQVSPTVGKLNAHSDINFSVTAHFRDVGPFKCEIIFVLQDTYSYSVEIAGNVVCPAVSITPSNIQIPKIPAGCYQRFKFKIKNTSAAKNVITFLLDDIPEFTVADANNELTTGVTLQPDETNEFTLKFRPTEPVAYSIYFPYKMNGMVGPPLLNDPRSLRPEFYFRKQGELFIKKYEDLPKLLKTLNIRCAASNIWFTFSSLCVSIICDSGGKSKKRFTITNVATTSHYFTVPLIGSNGPFSMKMEKKTGWEIVDDSWKFVIQPQEAISFKIEYAPHEYSTCTMEIPLYVEKFSNTSPFNYLTLSGVNPKPTITCAINILYFQAITTKEKISKKISLKLNYHSKDCVMEINVQHEALSVKLLRRGTCEESSSSTVDYVMKFSPKKECNVLSPITFSCSCGASYEILVRVSADNCIFCSYQSFIKQKALSANEHFETTFPVYPSTENNSFYARTVKIIKEDVERWLYSQGYFYMDFYKIPYGLARFPVDIHPRVVAAVSKKTKQKKKVQQMLPLVQLLVNLVYPSVTNYFNDGTSEPCFEGIEGVLHVYTVYKNILNFLEDRGVFVAQLKPEYLLPYSKYLIFQESISEEAYVDKHLTNRNDFLMFTKQAWLDLILRIYRVFVYNRVTNCAGSISIFSAAKNVYDDEFAQYLNQNREVFGEEVNESEVKLISWLEFHFHRQRSVLWGEKISSQLRNRKFRLFDRDLVDSLPFATLIMAYCPYMLECFHNFFPLYQNEEDMYHNACIIYEIWKMLHLSYDLRPLRIIKPSATEMEILVTYLYDVLPHFYPTETITFNTSLGEVSTNKLILKNRGDAVIAYTALFFNNDTGAFVVNTDIITIAPKGTNSLRISYKAKSILKKSAVLVLSGETIGYKFAKTLAFNLVGVPNIFEFTEEYSRNVEVFKQTTMTLEIASPFQMSYEAKLYFVLGSDKIPESLDEFVSVASLAARKVPTQFCINSECEFDARGIVRMKVRMCYVACGNYTYYIFFSNKDVGDFSIKVDITAKFPDKRGVNLQVRLPWKFSNVPCTCSAQSIQTKCPRLIPVEIPCRNQQLVDGLIKMFENCADEDEYNFWKPMLEFPKGFNVLREYLYNTFDDDMVSYKPVLDRKVTYHVRGKERKRMIIPGSITIENVTSNNSHRIEVHWNGKDWPNTEILSLFADHERETRKYILRFVKAELWPLK